MSLPRAILPNRIYLITRRCSERRFFMRPDRETTNAFVYCLTVAAHRTDIEVMFFVAMSNHYHAGVIDKHARLPEFLEYFHKLFAKHQNVLLGRWESFWSSVQTSVVELLDESDIFDKLIYTLSNPVKAGRAARASDWPGASSLQAQLRRQPICAKRPGQYFRPDGPMPEKTSLELATIPGFGKDDHHAFVAALEQRLRDVEQECAAERVRRGLPKPDPSAAVTQRWSDSPTTVEPRRTVSPTVAARDLALRIEALRRRRIFVDAYRAARVLLLAGADVLFPAGTYWLRRFARQRCVES